jgi:PAS domain S-box-containing protein
MPAAFDSSTGGAPDRRAAGAVPPDPGHPGPTGSGGSEPPQTPWRTIIGSEYGRSLTQLAASAVDPRHIEVERALFETLFDQVPVGIAIYDTDRRYVLVNKALAGYIGGSASEHVGRRPEEVTPDLAATVPLLQQHVLDTGEPVVDMLVKAATRTTEPGSRQYWSVSYARLQTEDGRVVGLTAVVVDVTERQLVAERNRKVRERAALLSAANSRVGATLDVDRITAGLADVAVPQFCDAATVFLLDGARQPGATGPKGVSAIASASLSMDDAAAQTLHMHVAAMRSRSGRSSARRNRPRGSDRRLPPIERGTALYDCLAGGRARLLAMTGPQTPAADIPPADAPAGQSEERSIVVPLRARGSLLGAVHFLRRSSADEFSLVDLETADELAGRTAVSIDNARLYLRERDTALMLQRSLLPQRFEAIEGTQVAFRYRPGPAGAQVGGDWWDVIPLPCRRIAFVIGDVMGSGLSAAGIMNQFRTAARTLAQLDLSPALVLRELDALGDSMSESHLATCVYTVYDPVAGECVLASAGHPPPVLATSGGGVELIEVSPGAPLGLGGQRFEERHISVEPGCALALYTDGLVEGRDRDIETGIDELLGALSKSAPAYQPPEGPGTAPTDSRWLEIACDAAFEALLGPQRGDDATLLIASLARFPEEQLASWVLTSQPTVASRARELVRRQLRAWSGADRVARAEGRALPPLGADVTDIVELLVSELVTNALRYGRGPIGLRLLRGTSTVVCEVSDELDAAPRLRTVQHGEEGGRGLYLVDQLSRSWGTRTTAHGKIVWFEV